jgi:hypothetical protein
MVWFNFVFKITKTVERTSYQTDQSV